MKCDACGARITLTAMETRARAPAAEAPEGLDADAMIGRELGGYRLTSVIGGGGMGIVFEAERTEGASIDGPPVAAVKVLSPAFARDPEFVARFSREADALLSLEHDNLIRVYGKGEHEGAYFFVMERFDGGDLRALMREGPIAPKTAAAIVAGAAAGLAHAHDRGIVHRDIKPANILVRGDPADDGVVKVVDFGVAQLAAPDYTLTSLTHSNLILGTVNYMSPEQRVDASNIDHRADVYALAVVAYELLTSRLPIGAFEAPSQLVRSLPAKVDRAIMQALKREPTQRPESAGAFSSMLTTALVPRGRSPLLWAGGGAIAAALTAGVYLAVTNVPSTTLPKKEVGVAKNAVVAQKAEPAPQLPTEAPAPEPEQEAAQGEEIFAPSDDLVGFADQLRRDIDIALKESAATQAKKPKPKTTSKKKRRRKKPLRRALGTKKSKAAPKLDLKNLDVDFEAAEDEAPVPQKVSQRKSLK